MTHEAPILQGKLKCFLICIVAFLPGVFPGIKNADLSPKLSNCYTRFANVTLDRVVGKFLTWHCETCLGTMRGGNRRLSNSQLTYVSHMTQRMDATGSHRGKRQARRCVRKEYRMLTAQERNNYHSAVNGLKQNTMVEPNVYDALAALHGELTIARAHGGPCFLSWHRVFLLMYEMALGDQVPGVCLPYWDSSLDNELADPSQTYMFSPELMGNGVGPVVSGPFAGWRRPRDRDSTSNRQPPLMRNVGVDGQLYTQQTIEMILSRNDHSQIISPNPDPDYDIEVNHGGIHMFVGGDMESVVTSPYDPIFYMHHAFVDYIWEIFRTKLRNQLNIDPSTNYPTNHNIEFHGPNELMSLGNLTCGQGFSDRLMDRVEYETSPYCSQQRPTCNSRYLRCQLNIGRCIPIDPRGFMGPMSSGLDPVNLGPGPVNPGQDPSNPGQGQNFCTNIQREKHKVKPCQNSYCLNGVCDINQWVFVPVKVVTIRPPGLDKYGSYPVINGDISSTNDIYQPKAYDRTKRLFESRRGKTPRGYTHCETDAIGQIFVTSQGMNYEGVYKESAIIDQRLATTLSIAYIAVKKPGRRAVTRVLFRAADSCGRVCHTSCRNQKTGVNKPCSGVLELDSRPPLMYAKNYGEATLDVWDYGTGHDKECPNFNNDNFFLTFYCDYQDHLPWVDKMTAPSMAPLIPQRHVSSRQGCRISESCRLDVPCYSATLMCRSYGETHRCRGSCGRYAVCNYGHYHERYCSGGMAFSEKMHQCTSTPCNQGRHVPVERWDFLGPSRFNFRRSFNPPVMPDFSMRGK